MLWLNLALADDIYVTYAADGTPLLTQSPPQNLDAAHRGEVYDELEVFWRDVLPGQYLPNGVAMPNLGAISNLDAYDALFLASEAETGVPAELLKAVAVAESRMNPQATSRVGARGLMQLMPATAASLGVTDATNPEQAIAGGAKYLAKQRSAFGTDSLALAAYNAGPGAVTKFGGIPPYRETETYVARVLGLYAHFQTVRPVR